MNVIAFVQGAVSRFLDDADAEQDDTERAAPAGLVDADAGRTLTNATDADDQALHDGSGKFDLSKYYLLAL